mgnify:CR=1 FL=1
MDADPLNAGPVVVLVEVLEVRDPDRYREYQLAARAQIGPLGGQVLARGANAVEGDPPFGTLLLQRWPSARAFLDWQASGAYAPLKALRQEVATIRLAWMPLSA